MTPTACWAKNMINILKESSKYLDLSSVKFGGMGPTVRPTNREDTVVGYQDCKA